MKNLIKKSICTVAAVAIIAVPVLANQVTEYPVEPTYHTEISAASLANLAPQQNIGDEAPRIESRVGSMPFWVVGVNPNSILNVRSGPGTHFGVVGTLAHNAQGTAPTIQFHTSQGWMRVSAIGTNGRNVSGYVSTQFIMWGVPR